MRNFNVVTRVAAILTASLALAACGADDASVAAVPDDVAAADATGTLDDAVTDDAAPDVAVEDAVPEDTGIDAAKDVVYKDGPFETATHYTLPQLVYGGVDVLHHPHIVTVTFAGDPYADQFEKFGATIQTLNWWDTWAPSYCSAMGACVGKGDSDKVRLGSTAAKSYTDSTYPNGPSTIRQFLKTRLDSADLPAPVTDTLYVVYLPQGTQVQLSGSATSPADKSCQSFGGYHHSMPYGTGQIAYAIIPECKGFAQGMTQLESALFASSHEISEAVTDPYTSPGTQTSPYGGFNINVLDQNVLAWIFALGGGEVGDLCPNLPYPGFGIAEEGGYKLTRVWSNIAAKGSHNPCVPADPGPYFNVAPEKNKGTHVKIEQGASATIVLHAFSDMPVKAWSLTAIDMDPYQGGGTALTFSFDGQDSITVNNGDIVNMTITRDANAQTASPYGAIAMLVSTSADGQSTNYWPIWSYTQAELMGP